MNNKELFGNCMKEAKELLKPHIAKAYFGDDDLLLQLAFILFKHQLQFGEFENEKRT